MKVVLNGCYGGFGLSGLAVERLRSLGYTGEVYDIPRNLPELVQTVEELGNLADGSNARLYIANVDNDWDGSTRERDGLERVSNEASECSHHVRLISAAEIMRNQVMGWLQDHIGQTLTTELVFELNEYLKGDD